MSSPLGPEYEPATRADLRRLDVKIDQLAREIHEKFVTDADLALVRIGIREVQEWQTWAIRIVLGAVMLALVGLVFTQNGTPA